MKRTTGKILLMAGAALLAGVSAGAFEVDAGDGRKINLGYNAQVWGQYAQNQAADGRHDSTDFFLRRTRFYANGDVFPRLSFAAMLDADNDGKGKDPDVSTFTRHTEAYVTAAACDSARLSFGMVKIPFGRQNLEGAFAQLLIDKDFIRGKQQAHRGEYDFGATLWGSPFAHRAKYYVSLMDGRHGGPNVTDRPRTAARLELHFLEPDAPLKYEPAGTYLGKKKVLALGAAYDRAPDAFVVGASTADYEAWTADLFFEWPWRDGAWTLEPAYFSYDHGAPTGVAAPADQGNGFYVQGGLLLPGVAGPGRLQPVARFSSFNSDNASAGSDERRTSFGLNYLLRGHDAKVQIDATRLDFDPPHATNPAKQDYWLFSLSVQIKT